MDGDCRRHDILDQCDNISSAGGRPVSLLSTWRRVIRDRVSGKHRFEASPILGIHAAEIARFEVIDLVYCEQAFDVRHRRSSVNSFRLMNTTKRGSRKAHGSAGQITTRN